MREYQAIVSGMERTVRTTWSIEVTLQIGDSVPVDILLRGEAQGRRLMRSLVGVVLTLVALEISVLNIVRFKCDGILVLIDLSVSSTNYAIAREDAAIQALMITVFENDDDDQMHQDAEIKQHGSRNAAIVSRSCATNRRFGPLIQGVFGSIKIQVVDKFYHDYQQEAMH